MRPFIQRAGLAAGVTLMTLAAAGTVEADGTWRGLTVAPEHRCAPYDRDDYPYSQSVEARIIADMGGRVYGPYTDRYFASRRDTDIEHMVATSEAHDSGLCGADAGTKRQFASDLLNLTLTAPAVNRPPEERERRWRVDAAAEPVLVRGPGRGGEEEVRAERRRAGGSGAGGRPEGMHLDRDGDGRRTGAGG